MASPVTLVLAAVGFLAVGGWLLLTYGTWDGTIAWLKIYGPGLFLVIQMIGIFYAGMTGRVKLAFMLIFTVCFTIWWGAL